MDTKFMMSLISRGLVHQIRLLGASLLVSNNARSLILRDVLYWRDLLYRKCNVLELSHLAYMYCNNTLK